jgi:hypothetical protein
LAVDVSLPLKKRVLEPLCPSFRVGETAGEATGQGGQLRTVEPLGMEVGSFLRIDAGLMSGTDPVHGLSVAGPEHGTDTDAQRGRLKANIHSDVFAHCVSPRSRDTLIGRIQERSKALGEIFHALKPSAMDDLTPFEWHPIQLRRVELDRGWHPRAAERP